MLSVLGVALLYDLGRRLFGPTTGAVAALLMASSPWAIYNLHGTWIQAFLEFACVTSAWFVLIAIQRNNGRRMFAGLAITALFMQTYLVAMALFIQVGTACGYALIWGGARARRALARPILSGLGLCVLSAAIFAVTMYAANPHFLRDLQAGIDNTPAPIPSVPNPFGIHLDLAGLNHSLRTVSGMDYENTWTNPAHPDYALRNALNDARATVIELLVGLGALMALLRLRWDTMSPILLTWFGLPVVLVTITLALAPRLFPEQWYLLITTPAGYLLAGIPFILFDRARVFQRPLIAGITQAGLAVMAAVAAFIPATNLVAHTNTVYEQPVRDQHLESLAEEYQLKLGRLWREQCSEIDSPQTILWVVSIFGTIRNVQPEASRVVGASDVWQVRPEGGNCVTRLPHEPAPVNAFTLPITLSDGSVLTTYRERPLMPPADFKAMTSNIGWTLVGLQTPPSARSGDTVTITHYWRVDTLPQEPYSDWYYAPFANLLAPDGRRVFMMDKAPSILGRAWQTGRYIVSTMRFQLPIGLTAGRYRLELSLFDPNQKRNAVYFDPAKPGEPILALERTLEVK
jgi:hypothetical protein